MSIASAYVTASDDYNRTQLRFNNRVYSDSPSRGENLLRCGINTSTYTVFIIIIYYSTNSLSRTTAHTRNCATVQPRNSRRASGARPPNSLLRLRETPYATLLVFPALCPRHDFSVTQNGRVSPITTRG